MELRKKFDFQKKTPYIFEFIKFINNNDIEYGRSPIKSQENIFSYKTIPSTNIIIPPEKMFDSKKKKINFL